ncbi:MAG: carbohydrate ABC transporter permease [bacterium]
MERRFSLSLSAKTAISAVIMLIPIIVFFVLMVYYPIGWSFWLAFNKYDLFSRVAKFVGLANFAKLIMDPMFINSFVNTAYFTVSSVFLDVVLSLVLAVALERVTRLSGLYKFVYFIPVVSPMVVVSVLWLWLYEPQIGLLNHIISFFGIGKQKWLLDPRLAMPSLIAMSVWKGLGFNMIIFVAGLKGISSQYYEAARVDGANGWQMFWFITLPLLSPVTTFVTVTSTIGAFQVFTQIYIMTRGGPVQSTTTVVYHIYENAFRYFKMGYASSMAVVLFLVILIFTAIQLTISRGGEY